MEIKHFYQYGQLYRDKRVISRSVTYLDIGAYVNMGSYINVSLLMWSVAPRETQVAVFPRDAMGRPEITCWKSCMCSDGVREVFRSSVATHRQFSLFSRSCSLPDRRETLQD
jgi:hypothetical protein